jgi:Ca2+-binding EF-hand superfamily protein
MLSYGRDASEDGAPSIIGLVERKLIKLFQNDFLSLLQIFRKIDRYKTNTISKQEFRAAIESNFAIELNDDEFEDFLKMVPKDGSNKIRYLEFMTRFDSDACSSLFDSESVM